MAEAWAKEWLALQIRQNCSGVKDRYINNGGDSELAVTPENVYITQLKALVASAAISTASVFDDKPDQVSCSDGYCYLTTEADIKTVGRPRKVVKQKAIQTMRELGVEMENIKPKTFEEVMMGLPTSAKAEKIIVMCDCKVSLDDLYQFGESVEEWKIDAPTVAFKAGDVQAYRRVCLDIKKEVDELMEKIFSPSEPFRIS